jgi:hypothetical protein
VWLPKSSFGEHKLYPSQTKILEGVTKDEMRIFEALFKGGSTQFGPRTIEKCFENPHFIFCYSFQNLRLGSIKFSDNRQYHWHCSVRLQLMFYALQNLRLGGVNFVTESSQSTGIEMHPVIYDVRTYTHPKRKCWKAKQTVPSAFSKPFPTFVGQIHSTHALEKGFEKHSERFVRPSNIRLGEHEAYLVMSRMCMATKQ